MTYVLLHSFVQWSWSIFKFTKSYI